VRAVVLEGRWCIRWWQTDISSGMDYYQIMEVNQVGILWCCNIYPFDSFGYGSAEIISRELMLAFLAGVSTLIYYY
jgi:hypothetical protein